MIKVLHIWGAMNRGGVESVLINVFSEIDKEKYECSLLLSSVTNLYQKELFDLNISTHYIAGNNFREINKEYLLFFKKNKESIDIVHIHYMHPKCFYIARAAKRNGIKTIIHSHLQGNDHGIKYAVCKFLLRIFTDVRIACSKAAGEYMFGKQKFIQYNNSINIDKFIYDEDKAKLSREKYSLKDKFVVGHIGRFCWQKNHEKLLEIFCEIRKIKEHAVLLMIGWGEWEEKIKDMVRKSANNEDILMLPPQKEVTAYFNMMDVFVLPSHIEGLPMVLVEAQANGLKCYTSTTVSEQAAITDRLDFIDLGLSSEKWAEQICSKDFSRKDVTDQIIAKKFDNKTSVKELEKIYTQLVKGKG